MRQVPAAHPELELPEVAPQLEVLQEREESVHDSYTSGLLET